jgi:TolB-like protein/DNA-binding winged helix-turn-helix (wHTH) protein
MELVMVATSSPIPATRQIACFGPFGLDLHSNELFKDGKKIRIQDHSLQILVMLLEKSGEIVTREELRQRLWHSETFVDFDQGLNTAMMRLRHALGETAHKPKYIETFPRHGYRFLAPVSFSSGRVEPQSLLSENGRDPPGVQPKLNSKDHAARESLKRVRRRGLRLDLVAAAFAALALLLIFGFARGRLRALLFPSAPIARIPTLAVLPLDSLSSESSQKFLAESITEQLITELGKCPGLRVLSRGSVMPFSEKHLPLDQVAKDLAADVLFEGSATQSGGRLRVTANLYQVQSRKHLWAETYETTLDAGLSAQREIVLDIAQKINAKLAPP